MSEPRQAVIGGGAAPGSGWTPRLVLSTLFLAMILEALSLGATMVSIGLPEILKEFPTTQGGWLTTTYFLSGAIACPLLGKAADLFGKRRVLMVALLLSGAGALICAVAPTFGVLLVGRALQGPVLATLSLIPSLIRDVYPPRQAVLASSITITGLGVFALFTPLFIGWLIESSGWRGLFWFDTVWTLALCGAMLLVTPESKLRQQARLDVLGGALLTGGVLAVLLYVSMGRSWGWLSGRELFLLLIGAVLLASFLLHTRRAQDPIVNLSLFRRKPLLLVAIGGAIGYGISITISQVLPLLALTPREAGHTYGLGLTTVEYAGIGTPHALMTVAAGLLVGFFVPRGRHPQIFLFLGLAGWAVGTPLLIFLNDSFGELFLAAAVLGLSNGLVNAAVPNIVMRATPAGDQGSTAGTVQLCQTGFSAVTPVVMFAVLAPHATLLTGGGVVYAEQGFRIWLVVTAVLALAMLLIGTVLLRERRGESVQEFVADRPGAAAKSAPQPAGAGAEGPAAG
ncbi:MFS transporter [Actinocorallia herbida]|uniref:MFS transporter n=1 Tax=Actinocorallia herbida TaxID=58109 RepID=A0A3N1D1V7_9ACTN|nr:MFS transporter [Actinocorallia herbida]ROO87505.1 MFS transporter [Actinocorallia herbida]